MFETNACHHLGTSQVIHHSSQPADAGTDATADGGVVAVPIEADQLGEGDIRSVRAGASNASAGHTSSNSATSAADSSTGLAKELRLQTYSFRASDLASVGASGDRLPPFAIVASKDNLTKEQAEEVSLAH